MADLTKKEKKHFFKGLKSELKKVIWPTKKQLINNTIAVIALVIIIALIVLALDIVFEKINEKVLANIRNNFIKAETVQHDSTTNENTNKESEQDSQIINLEDSEENPVEVIVE